MGDLINCYYPASGSPKATLFQLQNNQSRQLVDDNYIIALLHCSINLYIRTYSLYKLSIVSTANKFITCFITQDLSSRDEQLVH